MPMRLTKYEQETIILFNESESTAAVYTYNTGLQNTLNSLCQSHPEQVTQTGDNGYGSGSRLPRPGCCLKHRKRFWRI